MTGPMLRYAPLYLAVILVAGGAGVLLAWWMRRHTTMSIRNLYLAAAIAAALDAWALQARTAHALIVMGPLTSCAGSRRRVREFRISSDTFSELRVGEAVIHTTLGPPPTTCQIQPLQLRTGGSPQRIDNEERSACEIPVHPAAQLPIAAPYDDGATAPSSSPVPSAGKPTTPHQNGEDHTANNAHRNEIAPHQHHGPAQSFDDA